MTTALKQITDSLMALPKAQRIEVADTLYRSANQDNPEEVEKAWSDEIKRRLDEYLAGKVKPVPARQVHAAMRRKLNEIKARRLSSRRAA